MKTAYELAMERLKKDAPSTKLTDEQKARLAELDSKYAAKVAEREIALRGDIDKLDYAGEAEQAEELRRRLAGERKDLQAELEEKKDAVRAGKA